MFLNMGVEVAHSDSNAEADTIRGKSGCTALGSHSGRFYANAIKACMTQLLVVLLSPSRFYSESSFSAAEHIPDTEACKH